MGVIVYGQKLAGVVDRVPGLFHVATRFFHVQYVPLFPLGGHLVPEPEARGEAEWGVPIPISFKSVLAGYLRGWLAMAAFFSGAVVAMACSSFYFGMENVGLVALFAVIAVTMGALYLLFTTRTWWFVPIQLGLLLGSAAVYHDVRTKEPNAKRMPNTRPGTPERRRHDASHIDILLYANAAALLYSCTRALTPASRRRALELSEKLGIPPEELARALGCDPEDLRSLRL